MTSAPAPRLLLIAGSRSLGERWQACAWARDHLTCLLLGHREGVRNVVLTGGAIGPDVWACEIGARLGWTPVLYRPSGAIEGGKALRWGTPPAGRGAPLARNEAMVVEAARRAGEGWDVGVVGLIDLGSKTQGTAHCLGLAERAGLRVWRHEWKGDG